MEIQRAKRFWKAVAVVEHETAGFGVALDGRIVRAPSKQPLTLTTRALAEQVAAEWDAQEETINPHSMPLTQLANTAQDRMVPHRAAIIAELLKHVDGDTLCYFADEPQDLVDRQHAAWTPILAWGEDQFGCRWQTTSGIMPVAQSPEVHQAVSLALNELTADELAAYQVIAPSASSALIGLAVLKGRLNAEQAYAVSLVDELYQAELWGEDWEAQDRRERTMKDLTTATQYVALARS